MRALGSDASAVGVAACAESQQYCFKSCSDHDSAMKNILHPLISTDSGRSTSDPQRCSDVYRVSRRGRSSAGVEVHRAKPFVSLCKSFLRIWFEWEQMAFGWSRFPVRSRWEDAAARKFGFANLLADRLKRWHDYIDENYCPWLKNAPPFDWDTYNREGLDIAKSIKAHVGGQIFISNTMSFRN
ncbi:MAG: hypothetical protein MZV65_32520 [Chromatiales bacterium]|nr:hypothetical protein [Chromatiales bacterium]